MKRHYVYDLRNKVSGLRYIGVRSCLCAPEDDGRYWGSSKYVRADILAIGVDSFEKIIIAEYATREDAVAAEVALHSELEVDVSDAFYNRAKQKTHKFDTSSLTGERNHFFGKSHSELTKEKLRAANTGKIGYWRDHPIRSETKQKLREANLGKTHSDESKEKQRRAIVGKRLGDKHPMFGHQQTDEARAKIGDAMRGKPKSEAMKAKLTATQAARPCGFSGRKHSEETRQKIAASLRAKAEMKRVILAGMIP